MENILRGDFVLLERKRCSCSN